MDRLTRRSEGGGIELMYDGPYIGPVMQRLAAYEDAEEQGRLIVLPCKVGEPVWVAMPKWGTIRGCTYNSRYAIVEDMDRGYIYCKTREEAEAALGGDQDA